MFIPYGTDAPIYYWPFATVAIIVLNIVIYPIQMSLPAEPGSQMEVSISPEDFENIDDLSDDEARSLIWQLMSDEEKPGYYKYALSHGNGLHPIQWVTSFLMHAGVGHLLGNMLFLWAFGIIVEGKIGPWMFTLLYFAMGTFQNFAEQVIYLGISLPPSLGASSVIYALMVMAMIWAPRDNLLCVLLILWFPFLFTMPVLILSFLYLFLDFGTVMFSGFQLSSSMLHMMGGLVGLIPAIVMLKTNTVDCEQHDLFSLFREAAGKEPLPKQLTVKQQRQAEQERLEQQKSVKEKEQQFQKSISTHLNAGNVTAAERLMKNYRRRGGTTSWTQKQMLQLIKLYQSQQNWDRVIEYSHKYIERFAQNAAAIRINVAKVYLLEKNYPRKAIRELQQLPLDDLTEKQKQTVRQIAKRAHQLIDEGTIEPSE